MCALSAKTEQGVSNMDKWLLDEIEMDKREFVPVIFGNNVKLIVKKIGWPDITLRLAELTNQQFIEAVGLWYGAYNDCVFEGEFVGETLGNTIAMKINNKVFHFQK